MTKDECKKILFFVQDRKINKGLECNSEVDQLPRMCKAQDLIHSTTSTTPTSPPQQKQKQKTLNNKNHLPFSR